MSTCNKKLKKKLETTLTYHWYMALRDKEREFKFHELRERLQKFGMVLKPKNLELPEFHDMTDDEDNDKDFVESGKKMDKIKCRKRRGSSHI